VSGVNVLFLGGPKDGQRERMHSAPERYYVERLQKISTVKQELVTAPISSDRVVYIKVNLSGYVVYFAHEDLDFDKHPVTEAVRLLIENYRAIA
jgi:hypothetical protein